jgi:hypothetical protein
MQPKQPGQPLPRTTLPWQCSMRWFTPCPMPLTTHSSMLATLALSHRHPLSQTTHPPPREKL